MEVDIYSIDNKNYILVDKIESFLYLSNENDDDDMIILKEDPNNTDELLELDNETEFNKALLLFSSKNIK